MKCSLYDLLEEGKTYRAVVLATYGHLAKLKVDRRTVTVSTEHLPHGLRKGDVVLARFEREVLCGDEHDDTQNYVLRYRLIDALLVDETAIRNKFVRRHASS